MTHRHPHTLHEGELSVQALRGTPQELTQQIPNYIDSEMPPQHAEFYTRLSYLPIATLDKQGRPWATILVTQSDENSAVGIRLMQQNRLQVIGKTSCHDPFVRSLQQTILCHGKEETLFAGVGIDFANRRRNKLAGTIAGADYDAPGTLNLHLESNEHLGNCPKYITVRELEPFTRDASLGHDSFAACDSPLPPDCKDIIARTSTVFLATKHTPEKGSKAHSRKDMGLNHRGGAPGFVRVYEESKCCRGRSRGLNANDSDGTKAVTTYLVLPDFSGNRFYQSLGNIQSNPLVGLVFPDFETGNVLHLTGEAENLFGSKAESIMPRTNMITRIRITGVVFVKQALDLKLVSHEQYSPYNPPLRYLLSELADMGHVTRSGSQTNVTQNVSLVSSRKQTGNISTFTFQLTEPIEAPLPGGFGIFDFSEVLDNGYRHMNEANPQLINEDYVRTWTLSSAAKYNAEKNQFEKVNQIKITVKHKTGGLVSSFLHHQKTNEAGAIAQPLKLQLKGSGVGFSCFSASGSDEHLIPPRMLWVAGGVGITPFMSMWEGILNMGRALAGQQPHVSSDIVLLFAGRDDDIDIVRHFLAAIDQCPEGITLTIKVFQSSGENWHKGQAVRASLLKTYSDVPLEVNNRRLGKSDITNVDGLTERELFLCGPQALMNLTTNSLKSKGIKLPNIHRESYFF